jgi:hypothetical protein
MERPDSWQALPCKARPTRVEVSSGARADETVDALSPCAVATPTAARDADRPATRREMVSGVVSLPEIQVAPVLSSMSDCCENRAHAGLSGWIISVYFVMLGMLRLAKTESHTYVHEHVIMPNIKSLLDHAGCSVSSHK